MQEEKLKSNNKAAPTVQLCAEEHCQRPVHLNEDTCILHCRKDKWPGDPSEEEYQRQFYEAFCSYLYRECAKIIKVDAPVSEFSLETIEKILAGRSTPATARLKEIVNESILEVEGLSFPNLDSGYKIHLAQRLMNFYGVHLLHCNFYMQDFGHQNTKIHFDQCTFCCDWFIRPVEILVNPLEAIYCDCDFRKDVLIVHLGEGDIDGPLFSDCSFEGDLNISGSTFSDELFLNSSDVDAELHSLQISGCTFLNRFALNNCKTLLVAAFTDTEFKGKVEFKENRVEKIRVYNTNFLKLADFYKSQFLFFDARKSIFDDFAAFEECEFGLDYSGAESSKLSKNQDSKAVFRHVTFLSFINFRNTKFFGGLSLEDANLKEAPNFLNAEIFGDDTKRETYRIIKDSFDSIGNHIEANKYFAFEMKKYKEEVTKNGTWREKLILSMNEKISAFGQNYVRPIWLMMLLALIYYGLVLGQQDNWLYKILPTDGESIDWIFTHVNGWARHLGPFSKFLHEGMEFFSLIIHVAFGILIWQTVVAVKRLTRR
ncbi:hypothetical protein SAMN04487965_0416 [Microbulbifer donghaiensis]|uniref:Pentapeptide repeat-containing protein n=1 Tax=Microbulbifer donghaiensis TaxID=494016 RepID=A0A1M4VFZ2_9GAMM|nr:hypothetical protein [Microbulbifer donghaiensis]SHE67848.1 hypothetical protein SAMN04487965_0416 [Microbulbifer donghaiensis]